MTFHVPTVPPTRATRRDWIGLAVLALPCCLVAMDMTVLNLAIPHLALDLKPTGTQLLWIFDIYGFLVAGSLVTMGTLGDRIGRRRLLLIGASAFGLASSIAAFSKSSEMLIAMRAIQGLAGATLAPSTLSLIRNMFLDERQRTVALTVWMTSFSVGGTIGPLVGGLLLQKFWWGSVFLLNVPVMLLLLALGPKLLPEFKDPNAGSLDLASAGLSLGAILSFIFSLKRLAEDGATALTGATLLASTVLGTWFVRRQRNLSYPFVDLALFRRREFSTALGMNLLVVGALFGIFFLMSQYLQLVLGLSPLEAGLVFVPPSIAFVISSTLFPYLSNRLKPVHLIAGGLFLAAPGFLAMTQVGTTGGILPLVLGATIYQIALTPVFTLSTAIVVGSAPPERAGSAAAISETSFELGGAVGVATLGTLGTYLYRVRFLETVGEAAPSELVRAAQGTLGGAVALATQFTDAELVLGPAREAFAYALRSVACISTFIVVSLSILVALLLRHVKLGTEH